MGPILRRIVDAKRREVEDIYRATTLDAMRRLAAAAPEPRDFLGAVARPGCISLIAEVKKASPSKGVIREDFDPVAIARAYESAGANAISVLTDALFFQGSLDAFRSVRSAVSLPMLRKEFMIDPIQFYEARAEGADAVLLIASILSDAQIREFHALSLDLGMTPLVETHSEIDLRRVMTHLAPRLLGINNRDLSDAALATDLDHTARMLPLVRELAGDKGSPPIVSESGIYAPDDVNRLHLAGVSAILVGEFLMRQPDPGRAARVLMSRSV
ncbi:indole-3-glycerol phosphate synthase TrpC [Candidatus Sumerlaeota bacterium]|nr:indole-3-glycerol phosphate synthase TrpC [Candidatus Sumerlaeota bacterium]